MNRENAIRIAASLPESATVLDVGGGHAPFPRATHVLDALAFEERRQCGAKLLEDAIPTRFTRDTWRQTDVCDRHPWPYADKSFDYATCSHLLEDIRDPIWVCSELQRVARAGYIEVPSRILEQSLGVENPTYAGYQHHRWLVTIGEGRIMFQHKPHSLHTLKPGIVARVGATERINPQYENAYLEWQGSFEYAEELVFDEREIRRGLSEFADRSRRLPNLVITAGLSLKEKVRRRLYYARIRLGLG